MIILVLLTSGYFFGGCLLKSLNPNRKYQFLAFISPLLFVLLPYIPFIKQRTKSLILKYRSWKASQTQILTFISSLNSYLRAGYTLDSALVTLFKNSKQSDTCYPFLSHYVNARFQQFTVGQSLNESMAKLLPQKNENYLLLVLNYLLEGNNKSLDLCNILSSLDERIRTHFSLKRKVSSLTAQMRTQAIVITSSPFFLFIILKIINPSAIDFFLSEEIGNVILIIIIFLNIIGAISLRKICKIESMV